jgi:hypothetical protein
LRATDWTQLLERFFRDGSRAFDSFVLRERPNVVGGTEQLAAFA